MVRLGMYLILNKITLLLALNKRLSSESTFILTLRIYRAVRRLPNVSNEEKGKFKLLGEFKKEGIGQESNDPLAALDSKKTPVISLCSLFASNKDASKGEGSDKKVDKDEDKSEIKGEVKKEEIKKEEVAEKEVKVEKVKDESKEKGKDEIKDEVKKEVKEETITEDTNKEAKKEGEKKSEVEKD